MNDDDMPAGGAPTNGTASKPAKDGVVVAEKTDIQIVYVADPMCSWCYGFGPTINTLAKQFEGRMKVWPLMGGLRAGNTEPMSEGDKTYIREAWGNVTTASGKPFNYDFFERDGFIYDTEPVCRAVVTMRYMHEDKALDFMHFLSKAFYADGRDTTNTDELIALAGEFGVDKERFARGIRLPDLATATKHDFETARALGVRGFPALLAGNDDMGFTLMHNGFTALENISQQFEDWYAAQSQ